MKHYLSLMNVLIPEFLGNYSASMGMGTSARKKKRGRVSTFFQKHPGISLLLFAGFMCIYAVVYALPLSRRMMATGQQDQFLVSVGMILPVLAIFLGVLQSISSLYHENNIDTLLVLPVKPHVVVAAKVTQATLYVLLMTFMIFLPVLVVHGIVVGRSWGFYVQIIPFLLMTTVAPFTVLLIPIFILMRFTRFARNKDRFMMITNIVTTLMILAFILLLNTGNTTFDPDVPVMTERTASFYNSALRFLPVSYFSVKMLVTSNGWVTLLYGLIAFGITLGLTGIMLFFGNRLYIPGVLGAKGSTAAKALDTTEFSRKLKPRSVFRAMVDREWKNLLRSPAFFLQTVLASFLVPAVMIISVMLSLKQNDFDLLGFMRFYFTSGMWKEDYWIPAMILIGFALFIGGLNMASSTAVSRQGRNFEINKMLPVPILKQVTAWVIPGMSLSVGISVLIVAILAVAFHLPWYLILAALLVILLAVYAAQVLGLLIDLTMPKLDWTDEMQAVKNSSSTLISMLLNLVMIGAIIGSGLLVRKHMDAHAGAITFTMLGILLVLDLLFTILAIRKSKNLFRDIEL